MSQSDKSSIRRILWQGSLLLALGALSMFVAPQPVHAQEETVAQEAAPAADAPPVPEAPADTAADPATENPAETPAQDAPAAPWLSGSLRLGLDFAAENGETDTVLDQILRLDIQPPQHLNFRIRTSLWLTEDVDGHEPGDSDLGGLANSYGAAVQARLLQLYAEWDDLAGEGVLRVGRQRIVDSPAYGRIDGLYFKQHFNAWEWYAFAGARASIYDDSHEDLAAGAGASVWLFPKTKVALDYYYGEDDRRSSESVEPSFYARFLRLDSPRTVREEIDSRRLDFSLYQYLGDDHRFFGRYTWYDGRSDEMLFSLSGVFRKKEISYDLTYRSRLYLLEDRANDVTGFFRILGPEEAYNDLRAVVDFPLSNRFGLSLEGQIHDAEKGANQTANRDFERLGAYLHATELAKNLDGSIGVEYWDVSDGESSLAFNGEIARRWEKSKLTVGVDFERYKDRIEIYQPELLLANQLLTALTPAFFVTYEPLVRLFDVREVTTRENVYVFFAKYQFAVTGAQDVALKATVEEDDGPDSPYWRLEASYNIRF
ncbi:MAG: hypothetical protein HYV27_23585 [Candidatus Hydrogenedentes bacterium]|nr:hypothetical protein [Candidatus Hydrogenedentota bacterium]